MLAARDAAAAYQRQDMARVFQTARRRRANLCLHVAGESGDGTRRPRLVAPPVDAMDSVAGRHRMGGRGLHLSHRQLVACASGCPRVVLSGVIIPSLIPIALQTNWFANSFSHTCASTPRRSSCVLG